MTLGTLSALCKSITFYNSADKYKTFYTSVHV